MKHILIKVIAALVLATLTFSAQAEKIRDLADFAGVRDNVLVGYGLVVGLDGTGDQTTQAPFTGQSLSNMLSQLGVTVPPGTNMQLRNVAAVMVTADLPPFSRAGQRLDITVSSVGNARSLRGGTLLMTPLRGADGEIYALAQGNLLISGASAEAAGSSQVINHQSAGRIAGGAIVEREVPLVMGGNQGELELQLKTNDFSTVERVVQRINEEFGLFVASAVDGRTIRLFGPNDANERVSFMARIEQIEIDTPEGPARVVLNSRTGSIVLNGQVRLRQAAIAHGNLSIAIQSRQQASQPGALSRGRTVITEQAEIDIQQDDGTLNIVEGADLMEVVNALNALGATPADLMAILEALKASGSLRASLEII
ncbi:flagellar basal body P-ring protein FlgI [Aliidiomarina haloalkalitolerans]|uniref:Flagellar P-ring protein n=1 Tax=Aliidiomarina haloalkalitolerans TaxID=859059 RepID=A0A432VS83_9GAMM|nr:flagellar basal body P-ring protein FlgI [Aliidiomarina haloalkalitolerans]MCL4410819.1 flagellar basal body P-ring protein FlgI [Gammaproteobacteria bacterium]RUO19223.1 flagellar biosynthesis protein FlgI [Aliidiomarina haloalkalitolerans]